MIRTVIFDLDGLLIDTEIIAYKLYQDLLRPYGESFTVEEYTTKWCGRRAIENLSDILPRYHIPMTVDEGLAFARAREAYYLSEGIPLKPGARELLDWLKQRNYTIVLASSSQQARGQRILRDGGIAEYFCGGVYGPDVQRGKPFPDEFLKACEITDTAPAEALVLEDSEAGVLAAHAAGTAVICVPDLKTPSPDVLALADAVLPSLYEVIDWLQDGHGL